MHIISACRWAFQSEVAGITPNSNNFASDFIYVDEQGREYHDDPRILENWYGYGKPIYAPGAGVVLATANDVPENWFEDAGATKIGYGSTSSLGAAKVRVRTDSPGPQRLKAC